jgi:hypothetical protein
VAVVTSDHATQIAPYNEISWEDLAIYTNSHIGQKVKIRGKIDFIQNVTQLQILIGNSNAIVQMESPFTGLYVGDWITVYGEVKELYCFAIANMNFCYPLLINSFYEK